jgi:pimeloyl-ACP methyl ester carboxylesterase
MKRSLILLHGLFGGLSNWNTVIDHFENRCDILVPKLPVHEINGKNEIEFLVEFLESMIDRAKLNNVLLVGNSLGGHVAIRYTHRHPDKVAGLVLTGSSGLYENMKFGGFFKRGNYEYIRERVSATFYDTSIVTDEMVSEVLQVTTDPDKCLSTVKIARATKMDNVSLRLPAISAPVLLVWGKNDQITPPDVAYQFRDNFPNARLLMLPECGHVPMMEKPHEFNTALENFLEGLV